MRLLSANGMCDRSAGILRAGGVRIECLLSEMRRTASVRARRTRLEIKKTLMKVFLVFKVMAKS